MPATLHPIFAQILSTEANLTSLRANDMLMNQLEGTLDAFGLPELLVRLGTIAAWKAEHMQDIAEDEGAAIRWAEAGRRLDDLSAELKNLLED